MDCTLPGSSVHKIFQAKILESIAISSSKGSSLPRYWTHVSCISCIGRWILYQCITWETHEGKKKFIHTHTESSSVTQSCPTLCDPINCSTPGLSVHHQLLELTQPLGKAVTIIMLILRPRLRKGTWLAHSHTASKWDQDSNPCPCLPRNSPDGMRKPFSFKWKPREGSHHFFPSSSVPKMSHRLSTILIFWLGKQELRLSQGHGWSCARVGVKGSVLSFPLVLTYRNDAHLSWNLQCPAQDLASWGQGINEWMS